MQPGVAGDHFVPTRLRPKLQDYPIAGTVYVRICTLRAASSSKHCRAG